MANFKLMAAAITLTIVSCANAQCTAGDYPCGPNSWPKSLRKLIPQEHFGADFRSACRAHDACYGTTGAAKRNCDTAFLNQLNSACECSSHPIRCRIVARAMVASVRFGGGGSFRNAQGR